MIIRIVLLSIVIFSSQLFGQEEHSYCEDGLTTPLQQDSIVHLFVWNLYMLKKIDMNEFKETETFKSLQESNISLLQEIIVGNDTSLKKLELSGRSHYQIPYLILEDEKFENNSELNGFASSSKFKANSHEVIIGDALDIADGTQSMAILSRYPIEKSEKELLVIHIHNGVSIFNTMNLPKKLEKHIQNHNGPLVLSGDFNTFLTKANRLKKWAKSQGLADLKIKTPFGYLGQLDHTFFRGLKLQKESSRVFQETDKYSDHLGYEAKFKLDI